MSPTERLLGCLENVRAIGKVRWQASCPAHDDRHPSLSVEEKSDGTVLIHCHANCPSESVLEAVGLSWRDLFAEESDGSGLRDVESVYRYVDEAGVPLFEVLRLSGKQFRQRRPDGSRGIRGVRRVPYNLPAVLRAVERGEDIVLCEGEKDCDRLRGLGIVATTNPGGAGTWKPEYNDFFRTAKVTIVADRDTTGRDHARQVAAALAGVATELAVVECTRGKDISEHLANGGSIAELAEVDAGTVAEVPGARVPASLGELAPGTGFDPAKFRVLDVAAMIASEPPDIPWAVHGLAVQGDVTILTGDPGAGKSLLALTLAGAVARGESIAGLDCTVGSAVYLDAENGGREIHRRLHSLGIPHAGVTMVEAEGVNLRADDDLGQLEAVITHFKPTMVVLDSLTALWPGANERKTEDVAPILYGFKRIAERQGVAILVLHHRPKDGGEYRGTTAIAAAAQLGFTLSKAKGDPDRTRRRLACWEVPSGARARGPLASSGPRQRDGARGRGRALRGS